MVWIISLPMVYDLGRDILLHRKEGRAYEAFFFKSYIYAQSAFKKQAVYQDVSLLLADYLSVFFCIFHLRHISVLFCLSRGSEKKVRTQGRCHWKLHGFRAFERTAYRVKHKRISDASQSVLCDLSGGKGSEFLSIISGTSRTEKY